MKSIFVLGITALLLSPSLAAAGAAKEKAAGQKEVQAEKLEQDADAAAACASSTDGQEALALTAKRPATRKESGEKGGTEDINIGVGELQECTVSHMQTGDNPDRAASPK